MIKFKSREEKIEFLKGIQNKTRSLDEITGGRKGSITYDDDGVNVTITGSGGKILTREEAREMRNRTGLNLWISVDGKIPGGPAYQMWEADAPTNPKIGRHIQWILQPGNAPLFDNDEDYTSPYETK